MALSKLNKIEIFREAVSKTGTGVDANLPAFRQAMADKGPGHFEQSADKVVYIEEKVPLENAIKSLSIILPITASVATMAIEPKFGGLVGGYTGAVGGKLYRRARVIALSINR